MRLKRDDGKAVDRTTRSALQSAPGQGNDHVVVGREDPALAEFTQRCRRDGAGRLGVKARGVESVELPIGRCLRDREGVAVGVGDGIEDLPLPDRLGDLDPVGGRVDAPLGVGRVRTVELADDRRDPGRLRAEQPRNLVDPARALQPTEPR